MEDTKEVGMPVAAKSFISTFRIVVVVSLLLVAVAGLLGLREVLASNAEGAELASIQELTIYFIDPNGAEDLSEQSLAAIEHVDVPSDVVRRVFAGGCRRKYLSVWKGRHLGVAKLADGTTRRLAISVYGGFFSVMDSWRVFHVDHAPRDACDLIWRIDNEESFPAAP